jgi:hypothetical protein
MKAEYTRIRITRRFAVIIVLIVVLIAAIGKIYQNRIYEDSPFRVDIGTIISGRGKPFSFDVPSQYLKGKIGRDRIVISNCSCLIIRITCCLPHNQTH